MLNQFYVFRANQKTSWPPWPPIGCDIFDSPLIRKTRWPLWQIHLKGGTLYSCEQYVHRVWFEFVTKEHFLWQETLKVGQTIAYMNEISWTVMQIFIEASKHELKAD